MSTTTTAPPRRGPRDRRGRTSFAPAASLGRAAAGRPRLVLTAWLILILLGFAVGGRVTSRFEGTGLGVASSESAQASRYLDAHDPAGDRITALIAGTEVTAGPVRDQVTAAAAAVRAIPGVASVSAPYPAGVAADGRAVALTVTFRAALASGAEGSALDAASARLHRIDAPQVYVGGGPLLDRQMNHGVKRSLSEAEEISLPVILIGLFLLFGSVLAALLPLAVSLAGISAALLILLGFSHVTTLSQYALTIVTMIGLGVGVDYSLLIVSRFREERQEVWDKRKAARRAAVNAGRTVFFSGVTVALSSLGLCFFDNSFLRSIGLATASVVLVDMLAALTLLPALLALLGVKAKRSHAPRDSGFFSALARFACAMRHGVILVGAGVLVVLAVPLAGAHVSNGDARWLPASTESRQEYEAATEHFGSASSDPVTVLVRGDGPAYRAFIARIDALPEVASASAAPLTGGGTLVRLAPVGGDGAADALALVREVRSARGSLDVQVTGQAAQVVDFEAMLARGAPWAAGFVASTILVLLFAFTGSLLIPVKTLVTTSLSPAAALGAVVLVYQDGHGAGLLGAQALGSLDVVTVPCVAAIAFGLAMDYEIFILGRVREAYFGDRALGDRTGPESAADRVRDAVAVGLQRSGRIVSGAALLIAVVFACFMVGGNAVIGQIGLGLTLAVLLDATLVRMLLVPATMAALGRAAWWAPGPLRRLHRRYGLTESTDPRNADG